jgi:hypothetical protein
VTDEPEHFDVETWIASQTWTYAKSVPDWPHEYVVHPGGDRPDWRAMMATIARDGWRATFAGDGRTYRYLQVGSYDLWTSRLGGRLMVNRRAHREDGRDDGPPRLPGIDP